MGCKCDNLVAYFGSLLSVVDGQFQMEKMTGYDMQRVRNYDTELSHLQTGLQKGRDYVSRRMSGDSDDDRLALVLVQRQKISVFPERNRK
jgi:hypothetical protein